MASQRVVNLESQRSGRNRHSLPSSVMLLRDSSCRSMKSVLNDLFERSDDVLFTMSDKANSDRDQSAYFDAMRELRLRRKGMTLSILQYMARAFNDLGRFDPRPESSSDLGDVSSGNLTLLGDDETEQRVALENLITKLRNRQKRNIQLLVARIQYVCPRRAISERQMPLSPEVICTALSEACDDLDVDIRARLVVFKLFDRLLVEGLDDLYQKANELLVRENILPDLDETDAKRRVASPKTDNAPAAGQGTSPVGGAPSAGQNADVGGTFSQLTSLLHQGQASAGSAMGQGAAPVIDTRALLSHLATLQATPDSTGQGPLVEQVASVLPGSSGGKLSGVAQVDADVINLVTMLFDFILEDRQLPDLMKALIGRLQIPVLKVALLDRSFFNRGGHPARRLLNELAMAGIGWNPRPEGQRDPLREKIESVVDTLVNEFTDNVDLFDELLEDFSHFMDLDRRRRELIEQRLRDAEEGRAKQQQAQNRAAEILDRIRVNHELPEVGKRLFEGPLLKILEFTALRDEGNEEALEARARLAEQLAWTMDPSPIQENTRERLLQTVPGVVDELRTQMQAVSWDPFDSDSLIRDLEWAHVDLLQKIDLEAPRKVTPEVEKTPEAPVTENRIAEGAVQARQAETGAVQEGAESKQGEGAADVVEVEQQWYDQANALRVGSWVEVAHKGQRIRCKLAAIIRATGKFIFVNRNGAKVVEHSLDGVAEAMSCGDITMLDDGLIFDRALESVIGNLRENRRD